jgi:hypothetical protein
MSDWQVVGQNTQSMDEVKSTVLDMLRPILFHEREREREEALREKFPALQSAWEHYRMVLEICRSNNPELSEEAE